MMLELVELEQCIGNHSHYAYNVHYAVIMHTMLQIFFLLYTVVVQIYFNGNA